jgi:hypothetical protein
MTFGENRGTTSAWSDSISMGTRAKQDFSPTPDSWISFLEARRMEFVSFVENHRLRARVDSRNEAAVLELTCSICEGNAIPAPPGSTSATRLICRKCSSRVWRRRTEVRIRRGVEISDLEVCELQNTICATNYQAKTRRMVPTEGIAPHVSPLSST